MGHKIGSTEHIIFDELSIEKIKVKKNRIQRFVIRFKECQDLNAVPLNDVKE